MDRLIKQPQLMKDFHPRQLQGLHAEMQQLVMATHAATSEADARMAQCKIRFERLHAEGMQHAKDMQETFRQADAVKHENAILMARSLHCVAMQLLCHAAGLPFGSDGVMQYNRMTADAASIQWDSACVEKLAASIGCNSKIVLQHVRTVLREDQSLMQLLPWSYSEDAGKLQEGVRSWRESIQRYPELLSIAESGCWVVLNYEHIKQAFAPQLDA